MACKEKLFWLEWRKIGMKNKLENISLNGRLAYLIMCCESYLKSKHSDRDWTFVSKTMWEVTNSEYWNLWTDKYVGFIPSVLYEYPEYDKEDLEECFTEEEYALLKSLYTGLTEGKENDPNDEFAQIIRKPFDFCMAYEGTDIGDGKSGYLLIEEAEKILSDNEIPLPDYHKVEFSPFSEFDGWGKEFDGTHLSIVLNK